ncbi:MAG: SatD family protein [Thermodesulfovibrio sp.]|nr:SatD family protein [Thermodesulfovibrio sp.]
MSKVYTAIIGDIVKSRNLNKREQIQELLRTTLKEINETFKDSILSKFSIILGDEFQGLLKSPENSYLIIKEIDKAMYPVKIRFGVGIGSISTMIYENVGEMDGECFVRAREAIKSAEEIGQNIFYISGNEEKDLCLNTIFLFLDSIKSSWKEKHFKRVFLYEKLESYEKVAEKEKVSKQMISKMFKNIKYDKLKKAEKVINSLLGSICKIYE